jgi:8-oxo-(d)GTP phosphatase
MLIRAAGAVAWRPGPDGAEILLVHRVKYDDWSLPKGKVEPGEQLPVTATREVGEESGASIALGRYLIPVRYKVNGSPKLVNWWSARVTGVDDSVVPNDEVDRVAWLPFAEALRRVSYTHDVSVLRHFAAGPADTTPLILLRHARALPRSEWKGDDSARPLDKAGTASAAALGPLLSCFAPAARVYSSPAVRCVDTVRPYAELTRGHVELAASLASSRPAASAGPYSLISALVSAQEPAIVCAHRENLPALLDEALTAAGAAAPDRAALSRAGGPRAIAGEGAGYRVPEQAAKPLAKGTFLVLHLSGRTLAAIDRYEP